MNLVARIFRSFFWRLHLRQQHTLEHEIDRKLDMLLLDAWGEQEERLQGRQVIDHQGFPVVFLTDATYLENTLVSIYSLCNHAAPGTTYRVFLVLSRCPAGTRDRVERLFPGIEIYEHDARDVECVIHNHVTVTTMEKFEFPNLLPEEITKVLYLDGDVLVRHDLHELSDIDLGDKYAGVVRSFEPYIQQYAKDVGMKNLNDYFNAGVMLLNLKKMREDNSVEALYEIQAKHPDFVFHDNDCFNVLFESKVSFLPLKYNVSASCSNPVDFDSSELSKIMKEDEVAITLAMSDPSVVHYAGAIKPWKDTSSECACWWTRESFFFHKLERQVGALPVC